MASLLLVLLLFTGTGGPNQQACTSSLELLIGYSDPQLPLCDGTSDILVGTTDILVGSWVREEDEKGNASRCTLFKELLTLSWDTLVGPWLREEDEKGAARRKLFEELLTLSWEAGDFDSFGKLRLLLEKEQVRKQKITIIRWDRERLFELIYKKATRCIGPLQLFLLCCLAIILLLCNAEFRQDVADVVEEQRSFLCCFWHQYLHCFAEEWSPMINPLLLCTIMCLCDTSAIRTQRLAAAVTTLFVRLDIHFSSAIHCRWASFLLAYIMYPQSLLSVLCFIFPLLGRKKAAGRPCFGSAHSDFQGAPDRVPRSAAGSIQVEDMFSWTDSISQAARMFGLTSSATGQELCTSEDVRLIGCEFIPLVNFQSGDASYRNT